jgi:signal transduction histidine kinase
MAPAEIDDRPPSPPGTVRLDRSLTFTVAVLAVTLAVGVVAGAEVRIVAPGLDLVLDTLTTFVALAVAVLAWARFRDRGQRAALFQVAAFLALAVGYGVAAALALLLLDGAGGLFHPPGPEAALYVATLSRLSAAALLVIGGATSLRAGVARRPRAILAAPAIGVLVAVILAPLWAPLVPPLMGPVPAQAADQSVTSLPHSTPANVLLQGAGAALFFWASALARRRRRRGGSLSDAYLAVGLMVAGFAQLQFAFYPSAFTGVTTSGDLLYLAFDLILLLGIEAETRAYTVSLRQANLGLERLRDSEVERAAMEERARLSRELHDGLAQDLWFAKLKVGRLAALPGLEPEARQLCAELDDAIDSGLVEARQAVMALRIGSGSDPSLTELMTRFVDDFADRYGIPVELDCDDVPRFDARVEAELLRITQEALSNVRRHADATVVWVRVSVEEGRVVLSVRDNGKGFDPGAVGSSGFGLTSMAERAALVGGRLEISSRASNGSIVSIDVALPPIADPGPTHAAGVVA